MHQRGRVIPFDRAFVGAAQPQLIPFYRSYADAAMYPDPRAGFNPGATRTFTDSAGFSTIVNSLANGDLVKYTGTGVLNITSASDNGFIWPSNLSVATKAVFDFGHPLNANHVKFSTTSTSNFNGTWVRNPTNIWMVGGEMTASTGGAGILWYGGTTSGWIGWIAHDCGTYALYITPASGPQNVTGCVLIGEGYNLGLTPAKDSHVSDPGSGIHGAQVSDGNIVNSIFQNNLIAVNIHNSSIGSGMQFGDSTGTALQTTLRNNKFMVKATDLNFSGSTTSSMGFQIWGNSAFSGNTVELLQAERLNGRATLRTGLSGTATGNPGLTVLHGRAIDTNQDSANLAAHDGGGIASTAAWDTRSPSFVVHRDNVTITNPPGTPPSTGGELAAGSSDSVSANNSFTLSNSATSGTTAVLIYATRSTAADITSVTDSKGNTWSVDVQTTDATGKDVVAICSTRMTVGTLVAGDVVTVHHTTAPLTTFCYSLQTIAGLATSSYVNATATSGSAGASVTSGSTGTTAATTSDGIAVAGWCIAIGTQTFTPPTGWTAFNTDPVNSALADAQHKTLGVAFNNTTSGSTVSGTASWGSSQSYNAAVVVYKVAGTGGGPTTPIPAVYGYESGSPQIWSPFTRVQAHNGANPTDTTHANFGTFSRVLGGASSAPAVVAIYSGSKFTTIVWNRAPMKRGANTIAEFTLTIGGVTKTITNAYTRENFTQLTHWSDDVVAGNTVVVSYSGTSVQAANGDQAASFSNVTATTGTANTKDYTNCTQVNDNINPATGTQFSGTGNTYLYRPTTAVGTPPLLIMAFHTHAPATDRDTKIIQAAESFGFCVAILDGADGYAIAGGTPYVMSSHASTMKARIANYCSTLGADPNNVYMTGQSAGATFACFLTDTYTYANMPIKGIAPVDGSIYKTQAANPPVRNDQSVLVLGTWGGADTGGTLAGNSTYHSMQETLAIYAGVNGTASSTETTNLIPSSSTVLTQNTYDGNVFGQVVTSGQHIWQGANNPGVMVATGNDALYRATDFILQWMLACSTPQTATTTHVADTGSYYGHHSLDGPTSSTLYVSGRNVSTDNYDRCESVISTAHENYLAGTETWYTAAYWLPSWSSGLFGAAAPNNFMSVNELNYHGYGAGGNGPNMVCIIDRSGTPAFRWRNLTGWAAGSSPAYQYNSETGFGYPGGAVPNNDILPAGQVSLNVWHRFIYHVVWDTGPAGLIEVWHQVKGDTTWTKTWTQTGFPTVQWPVAAGTSISNATYNANYAAGQGDTIGPYRHYSIATPMSWSLDTDSFDNTATSFNEAAARFL